MFLTVDDKNSKYSKILTLKVHLFVILIKNFYKKKNLNKYFYTYIQYYITYSTNIHVNKNKGNKFNLYELLDYKNVKQI